MPKGDLAELLKNDFENAKREVEEEFGKKALKEESKESKPKKAKKKPRKSQVKLNSTRFK